MNSAAKWIVLFGILVFSVVGMTALDKYDERSCRDDPRLVRPADTHIEVSPDRDLGEGAQVLATEFLVIDSPAVYETCDGFLPW